MHAYTLPNGNISAQRCMYIYIIHALMIPHMFDILEHTKATLKNGKSICGLHSL